MHQSWIASDPSCECEWGLDKFVSAHQSPYDESPPSEESIDSAEEYVSAAAADAVAEAEGEG